MVREVFPFEEKTLDRLFDSDASKFEAVLKAEAGELYAARETEFTADIMRKIERDIYLQILDNLWMQHLENMEHLREGIHWISVGQRDPLVEYRRQAQVLFDEMQRTLQHEVVSTVLHAQPVKAEELDRPVETELTRAARQSINNADTILEADREFEEADFEAGKEPDANKQQLAKKQKTTTTRKKAHKVERKRKAQGRKLTK